MIGGARKALAAALSVAALILMTVSMASAAPPPNVHIEVPEVIGVNGDPFTASGAAVSAGVICASGSVDDLDVVASGSGAGPFVILHAHKRFTCGDFSGAFDVKMTVRLDTATNNTTASWRIVGGTGAYSGLHGSGSLVGSPIVPDVSVFDVYDGRVH
jgi:hypothetical protein